MTISDVRGNVESKTMLVLWYLYCKENQLDCII